MTHFDLNWDQVFEAMPLWERVPPEARRKFLKYVKPSQSVRKPDLGDAFTALDEVGFFQPSERRIRATLKPRFKAFVKVMRAMDRSEIYDSPTPAAFGSYLIDNFTPEERSAVGVAEAQGRRGYYANYYQVQDLYRVTASSHWVQTFVSSSSGEWHGKHVSRRQSIPDPQVHAEAKEMVRFLIERDGAVTLQALRAAWEQRDPARLADALVHGIRQLVVFPALRDGDHEPIVCIWPAAAARLAAAPPKPPVMPKADEVFYAPFLLDDMASIVVVCASEPLRLRGSDYGLFAKAEKELAAQLEPLPEWLAEPFSLGPAARTDAALRLLEQTSRVAQKGVAGRDLRLEVTKKGREWLSLSPKERLQGLLDQIREDMKKQTSPERSSKNIAGTQAPARPIPTFREGFDDDFDDEDDYDDGYGRYDHGYGGYDHHHHDDHESASPLTLLPYTVSGSQRVLSDAELTEAVRQRCADLPSEGFVDATALLEFEARAEHPLKRLLAGGSYLSFYLGPMTSYSPGEADLDIAWSRLLSDTFCRRLLPLGAVKVGLSEDGALSLGLTAVGRYLFDLTQELSIDLPDHEGSQSVVVQPNFDVVFLAPAPSTEVVISQFAERRGRRVGVLFQITKQSIFTAAASGLTAVAAIENLRRVCANELPANVEREIRGWFAQCRYIEMQPSIVIRCPDEDTAARVRSVGKGNVKAISETVLEFSEPKQKTQFVRKLRGMGIFV